MPQYKIRSASESCDRIAGEHQLSRTPQPQRAFLQVNAGFSTDDTDPEAANLNLVSRADLRQPSCRKVSHIDLDSPSHGGFHDPENARVGAKHPTPVRRWPSASLLRCRVSGLRAVARSLKSTQQSSASVYRDYGNVGAPAKRQVCTMGGIRVKFGAQTQARDTVVAGP
jgi:hypothetical protein